LLLACLIWIGLVLALTVLGIAASIAMNHETAEVRIALSRSNVIGLIGVLLIPPLCLTVQWWRMRRRRRNGRETSV
jgi:hypothetical protein